MIKDMESGAKGAIGPGPARSVWVTGPATLASVGLERALGGLARCHRGEEPPPSGDAPSAVVVFSTGAWDGPEAVASEVRGALRAAPGAVVVVLGPSPDAVSARAAVRAGAGGFLHAGMPPEQVARAVLVALGGEVVLTRGLLEGLVASERSADLSVLGPRQREVVGLVAEGLSNAEVASRLYLSESTVKQHLRRAYKAMGVKNRREAAAALRRDGGASLRLPPTDA